MDLSQPFKDECQALPLFCATFLQAIDGLMFSALCLLVVSQAPQHCGSSEMQTTCYCCFAHRSAFSVIVLLLCVCVTVRTSVGKQEYTCLTCHWLNLMVLAEESTHTCKQTWRNLTCSLPLRYCGTHWQSDSSFASLEDI